MPAFVPVGIERVSIGNAFGRFLAEEIRARFDLPPFTSSSMDGYAVRSYEVAGASEASPKILTLQGESRSRSGPAPPPLADRTAMRIFTRRRRSRKVADAIVIQKNTKGRRIAGTGSLRSLVSIFRSGEIGSRGCSRVEDDLASRDARCSHLRRALSGMTG